MLGIAGIIYIVYTVDQQKQTDKLVSNQDYIIKSLNDSENQRQAEKIAVLDTIKKDLEEKKLEHQRIIDNITTLINGLNLTVVVHDNQDSDTDNDNNNNATGKISAFLGQPIEILNSTQ